MKKINFLVMLLLLISFFLSQSSQIYAAENVSDEIITLKPNETYDLENNRIVEMYALKDTVQPQNTALEVAGLGSIAAFLAANPLLSLGILLLGVAAIAVGVRFKNFMEAYDFGERVRQFLSDAQFAYAISGFNIVYTIELINAIQSARYSCLAPVSSSELNDFMRPLKKYTKLDIENVLGYSIFFDTEKEGVYDTKFYTKSITVDVTRSTGFSALEIKYLKNAFSSDYGFIILNPYYVNFKPEYQSNHGSYYDFGTCTPIKNGYRLYFDIDMVNNVDFFISKFHLTRSDGPLSSFVGSDVNITFSNGKKISLYGDVAPFNQYYKLNMTQVTPNLTERTFKIDTNKNITSQSLNADSFIRLNVDSAYLKGELDLASEPLYSSYVTEASSISIPIDDAGAIDDAGTSENAGSSENSEEEEKENNEVGWLSKIFSMLKTFLSTLQKSVDNIGNFVKSIPDLILSIPEKISLAMGDFVAGVQGIFDNLTNLVREIFQWLKDFFIPDFSKINQSITNLKNKFDDKFKSITNSISSFKSIFTNGKSIYDLELTIFNTTFHPVPIVAKPVIDVARMLFNAFIMFLAFNNVRKRFFGEGDAIAT